MCVLHACALVCADGPRPNQKEIHSLRAFLLLFIKQLIMKVNMAATARSSHGPHTVLTALPNTRLVGGFPPPQRRLLLANERLINRVCVPGLRCEGGRVAEHPELPAHYARGRTQNTAARHTPRPVIQEANVASHPLI